jgi:ribosomal peptide maturation radical SAM protein 1
MQPYDTCLLAMPFPSLSQPSMGISVLQAALQEAGISTCALYPCMWFAEEVGLDVYSAIYSSKQEFLIGEWVFAGVAFPELDAREDEYLDLVLSAPVSQGLLRRSHFASEPREALRDARRAAHGFVERVADRVLERQPTIVGCTSTFAQHCASLAVLRVIKFLAPHVITVMGGANCEAAMGVATKKHFPWVDFVVSGEADLLAPELFRRLLRDGVKAPVRDLHAVIDAAHPSVRFGVAAPRASVSNLDATPVPVFDDFLAALAESPLASFIVPGLALESSRGCWWGQKHHCTFCGLNGSNMTFRSKSPDRVLSELTSLAARHGIRRFNIVDNILDLRYVRELLPRIPIDPPYHLFYETKSNLRRDQLEQLARAGIRRLQPGIESMHDEILRLIDKGTTALQNLQLLKWARELGVFIAWNFLWDLPGERDEWYAEMARWLPRVTHLQPPGVDRIQFHRFSPYHQRPADWSLQLEPHPMYSYVYPLDPAQLAQLAYYFHDPARTSARVALASRPGLTAALREIGCWTLRWGQGGSGPHPDKPLLHVEDAGEDLAIRDTRPCGRGNLVLQGLTASVHRACESITSVHNVVEAVSRLHPTASSDQILAAIDELDDKRLLLRVNDKLLALALRQIGHILDESEDSPGGHIDVDRWYASNPSVGPD